MVSVELTDEHDELFEYILEFKKNNAIRENEKKKFSEGSRNSALTSLAGVMRKYGASGQEIACLLSFANKEYCRPSLEDSEVERISKSISNYPVEEKIKQIKKWNIAEFMEDESFTRPIPVVEGLFHLSEFHIISAPAKAGKSLFVMNLALAIASGTKFLDYFDVSQGKVMYLQTEIGNFQLKERLTNVLGENYNHFADNLMIVSERIKLDKKDGIEILRNLIIENELKVLILDPFYTLHNSNEDSSTEMAPVLSDIREVALDLNCLIIMVHHQGKAREGDSQTGHKHRGSSSFADVPDGSISIKRNSKLSALFDAELRNLEAPPQRQINLDGMKWVYACDVAPWKLTVQEVIDYVKDFDEICTGDLISGLTEKYGVKKRSIEYKLKDAVKFGHLIKEKKGRNTFYSINKVEVDISALTQSHKE